MVAYSFHPRFIDQILAGTKRQTIRADRKRHARIGEQLQLYSGMRTKQCKLIGRAECEETQPIRIDVEANRILFGISGVQFSRRHELDHFARLDGFADWLDMRTFWRAEHPDVAVFSGVLVRWGAFHV